MAWTQIVSGHNRNSGSPYTTVPVGPLNCNGADLIVCIVAGYTRSGQLSSADITDDVLNSYTLLAVQTNSTDSNLWVALWYSFNPIAHGTQDFQFLINSFADDYASMVVYAFSGLAASPSANYVSASASGTTIQPGSLGVADDLIVSGLGFSTTVTTASADSGFATAVLQDNEPFAVGSAGSYKEVSGAVNPTWTLGASTDVCGINASFTGTGGGGVNQPMMRRWGGVHAQGGQGIGNRGPGRSWGRTKDGIIVPRRFAA